MSFEYMDANTYFERIGGSLRILVFIPAYNCEKQISRVLAQFTPEILAHISEILLIDNVSNDATIEIACDAAKHLSLPIVIMRNNKNYHYGGSVKVAIRYAVEKAFDYLLILHGDDQANIADFQHVLSTCQYARYDAVLGSRFQKGALLINYNWFRNFGNRILNMVCSILVSYKIYDLGSGLNIYKIERLADLPYTTYPNNLTFEAHMLIGMIRMNNNILNIPISWREIDQVSNARIFRQAANIVWLFFASRWKNDRGKTDMDNIGYLSEIIYSNKP